MTPAAILTAATPLLPLAFEAPRALWLLAAALPLAVAVAALWPLASGARRALAIGLRVAALAAVAAALARPVWIDLDRSVSAVALLDVSASVSDAELGRERQLAAALSRAAVPPDGLRIVAFAAEPVELEAPGAFVRPTGDAALATDVARALGLGAGLLDATRTPRVLLVSDGRATHGDALAQAERLAARGVRVDYVRLGAAGDRRGADPEGTADVAVAGLSAPDDVRPHAPFPLQIRLVADRAATVRLSLLQDGRAPDGGDLGTPGRRTVAVAPGETVVSWMVRIEEPGISVFSAAIAVTGQATAARDPGTAGGAIGRDAHPENDRGVLAVAVDPPPRVLVLAQARADVAALIAALGAEKIDVDLHPPGRAPGDDDLARADLVVLADVPGAALAGATVASIERYVQAGGGLLVTGGPRSYGPGGWDATRLPALLPVRLDLPERREDPTLALALVIDRSGSMTGPKIELTKQAARATAEMLPAEDQLVIVAFDTQASVVVRLQRAANRLRIAADIGRIQASGGTNILAGLREGVDALTSARAKKKHVILLSDGQSSSEGIAELVDAAASSRITVSSVGVGDGADEALLQLIANRGGGRYYHTRDPASIPRIFTREASELTSTGIVERPTPVILRKRAEMLAGIPLDRAPQLGGYVRTRPRPQAELLLATDGGDPLLARWHVGLGEVVAWTSDLGPRWANTWTRWPPFPKLWAQMARATMRARAASRFPLGVRLGASGTVDVDVEAVAPDDRFLSGLEGTLEITTVALDGSRAGGRAGGRGTSSVPLAESAPGRYQARFPLAGGGSAGGGGGGAGGGADAQLGALLLEARLSRGGRPVARATGRLALPLAPELLPATAATSGAPLLEAIAARTGGGVLANPSDLFASAEPRGRSRPLHPPLLALVAVLLVAEVTVRRLTSSRAARARAPGTKRR